MEGSLLLLGEGHDLRIHAEELGAHEADSLRMLRHRKFSPR
jgi:hypothetical protein